MANVLFPTITLDSSREYHTGLLSLDTCNSIPNRCKWGIQSVRSSVSLIQAASEVTEIQEIMQELLLNDFESNDF